MLRLGGELFRRRGFSLARCDASLDTAKLGIDPLQSRQCLRIQSIIFAQSASLRAPSIT
jgi:hypothetical protein